MRIHSVVFAAFLAIASLSVGCAQNPKESSSQASIQKAQSIASPQEKADYLVGQARAFYNSKQFQDAVNTAQYVLQYVDKDSASAKSLLEKAKTDLMEAGKAKADEVKKQLGF